MRLALLLAVLLAVPAICTAQTTWFVPDDFSTIQGAISDASVVNGDSVIVRPGTYVEKIDFLGKAIALKSEQGADFTIIDGNQAGSVVTFENGEDAGSIIAGFTLTNGVASRGGGIMCNGTSPTITDNKILKNQATTYGGGIYCESSSPALLNNQISENYSNQQGGGLYAYLNSSPRIEMNTITFNQTTYWGGGMHLHKYCSPLIEGNSISHNQASQGGGIDYTADSLPTIRGNSIHRNKVDLSGGGIRCASNDGSHEICNNDIFENEAFSGGGIYCFYSNPVIENNRIADNYVVYDGGGLESFNSEPVVRGNRFLRNRADREGGAFHADSSWSYAPPTAEFSGNIVFENSSSDNGGGIFAYYVYLYMANNAFINNRSQKWGGGIYSHADIFTSAGDLFWNNKARLIGGGLYVAGDSVTITNNTVLDNESEKAGGMSFWGTQTATLSNNIIRNNHALTEPQIWGSNATLVVQNNNIQGGWPTGTGNMDCDPLFIDEGAGDFHLTYNSLCKNSGYNGAPGMQAVDFEGDPRITDGQVDMGADEYHPHLYYKGNAVPSHELEVCAVGEPASPVTLFWGAGMLNPPFPTFYGYWYLDFPVITIPLGTTSSEGWVSMSGRIPEPFTTPSAVPLQAFLQVPGILTNLCVVDVE